MAYKVSLVTRCKRCPMQATHEVFNTWNATMGKFCDVHADEEVKIMKKVEQEQAKRSYKNSGK